MKPQCPCYGCEGRCVGCHSVCEPYKLYAAETAKSRAAIFKAKQEENLLDNFKKEAIHRMVTNKRDHHRN